MKLAVSTLAWEPGQDDRLAEVLRVRGVAAIELTPLKYWPQAPEVSASDLRAYAAGWASRGISIVALQAILFGRPELQLFGADHERAAFERHLIGMTTLARALGAGVIVLGAPRNRLRGSRSEEAAIQEAAPLFRRVATAAAENGCVVCVEPNPPRYGGDFVGTTSSALELVRSVDHPGFGLHLDAGALAIAEESDDEILAAARAASHYHVSEIDLAPVGAGTVDHRRLGRLLVRAGFSGWRSIEMRPQAADVTGVLASIHRAIDTARAGYEG